jgi:transposase
LPIGEFLRLLNEERPIRRLGATRRRLLEGIDRAALKPLPIEPYEFCEWRACRVGIDYHVEADAHYYSVPRRFARAEVDVRLTVRTVEVFLKGGAVRRAYAHERQSHAQFPGLCSACLPRYPLQAILR